MPFMRRIEVVLKNGTTISSKYEEVNESPAEYAAQLAGLGDDAWLRFAVHPEGQSFVRVSEVASLTWFD